MVDADFLEAFMVSHVETHKSLQLCKRMKTERKVLYRWGW